MSKKKYLTTFNEIIEEVLDTEGGFVDDPLDRGGRTKYGISQRVYPDLDIAKLDRSEAKKIYHQDYWRVGKCDEIPPQLRHVYFDGCVNHGISGMIRILQRTANSQGSNLIVDGKVGPKTLNAIRVIETNRLKAYRIRHYCDIVTNDPHQERFYYGWFKRVIIIGDRK